MTVHALGPPHPGDPAQIGGLRILGRLGAASQGVVFHVAGPLVRNLGYRHGPLDGGELDRLATGTAEALAIIHDAGIVHRDFSRATC